MCAAPTGPSPPRRIYRTAATGLVDFLERDGRLPAPDQLLRRDIEGYYSAMAGLAGDDLVSDDCLSSPDA